MKREFRFDRGQKLAPLVWEIEQHGESYSVSHGQLHGAMQTATDTPGDKGKPGTAAYVDPVANCEFHINREIRKKIERGYIEYINGKPSAKQLTEVDFRNLLPKNFCGYKPQTDIDPKALVKLHATGKARYTRKIDGTMHLAVHHTGGWEIYSRRIDLASERFPLHVEALSKTDFPVGTILVGEMVCLYNGKEDFKAISRICRSLPEGSRKLVEDGEVPEAKFVVFDMLFHNGQDLKDSSYDERAKIWNKFPPMAKNDTHLIASIDYYDVTPDTWETEAKKNGWEGFVVTDGAAKPGDKFYSYDGTAKRPKGHHKLKPTYEDDIVIFAASPGTGKRLNGIGSVHVKQLHPETGKWMYCGKVGSGFTDESLEELENLFTQKKLPIVDEKKIKDLDLDQEDNLLVAMIEYGERQPGTQKFRFPVFVRIRDDKTVQECVAQRLAAEEE